MKSNLWLILLLEAICNGYSFRILFVFPSPLRSHYILGEALAKGLVEAGHDVTMISPFEDNYIPKKGKYRNVVLSGMQKVLMELKSPSWLEMGRMNPIMQDITPIHLCNVIVNFTMSHSNFQKLIQSSHEKFDVIVLELFLNDALKFLSRHFDAPLILYSTMPPNFWTNPLNGNPAPPSYIPDFFQTFSTNMTLLERATNSFFLFTRYLVRYFVFIPKQLQFIKHHFPQHFTENIINTGSLTFVNSHESVNHPVPTVPTIIPIGGIHIKPTNKLPIDLQEYLDSAQDGAIYFSLGSNVLFSTLDNSTKNNIIRTLGNRKEKIILTCDEDLYQKPNNILIRKWSPQQDILAHPNVKLFVSHGGLLSIMEAVNSGVPILTLPLFGDQRMNGASIEQYEYGSSISFHDLSTEKLSEKIETLLNDPKYRENIKKRSTLFRDRPMKPMDVAIYWTEFVARHKDVSHLKTAGLNLDWYQYLLLDVIAFFVIVLLSFCIIVYILIKIIYKKLISREKIKTN